MQPPTAGRETFLAHLCVLAACLGCCLAACSASSSGTLVVNLRTDLVPAEEFGQVRLSLGRVDAAGSLETVELAAEAPSYVEAARLTEFTNLAVGSYRLTVVPLGTRSGEALTERPVLLEIDGSLSVTVPIFRSCLNVDCGDEEACFGGQCVDPRCSVESEEFCSVANECGSDVECAPQASCAVGSCELGVCWNFSKPSGASGACDIDTQWCDPDAGCQLQSGVAASCADGIQNGDEEGVDCGPSCSESCRFRAFYVHDSGNCMAYRDGRTVCWGENDKSQLAAQINDHLLSPELLTFMNGAEDLAWQGDNTEFCGLFAGSVLCGEQPGLASPGPQSGVTAIAGGSFHSCLLADGDVYCWGTNDHGQVGIDNGGATVPSPTRVEGLLVGKTVTDLDLGTSSSCAVADASVYCWGSDESGRLGDGEPSGFGVTSFVPVAVAGDITGKSVDQVSAGARRTCARSGGEVYCWGSRAGPASVRQNQVPSVITISTGAWHNCAINTEQEVLCWGHNDEGQLSIGSEVDVGNAVVTVPLPAPARFVGAGNEPQLRGNGR